MTAEINKAVERLTRQMFDADTHYGSDQLGWMVGDVATEDLRLVISELSRLREENATLSRERDEAREALEPFASVSAKAKGSDDACWCGQDGAVIRYRDLRLAERLARQSKEGGEARP